MEELPKERERILEEWPYLDLGLYFGSTNGGQHCDHHKDEYPLIPTIMVLFQIRKIRLVIQ